MQEILLFYIYIPLRILQTQNSVAISHSDKNHKQNSTKDFKMKFVKFDIKISDQICGLQIQQPRQVTKTPDIFEHLKAHFLCLHNLCICIGSLHHVTFPLNIFRYTVLRS